MAVELDARAAGARRLADKVCVVTGAGQGIGRAAARRLGQEGGKIVVADRIDASATRTLTELHEHGVDVLSLVLGETDTPALRRLRAKRGQVDDPDAPLPGVTTVEEVVADAIERLPHGPSWMVGEQLRTGATLLTGGMTRNELVAVMVEMSQEAME